MQYIAPSTIDPEDVATALIENANISVLDWRDENWTLQQKADAGLSSIKQFQNITIGGVPHTARIYNDLVTFEPVVTYATFTLEVAEPEEEE